MIDHAEDCATVFDYSRYCNCGAVDVFVGDHEDVRDN